MAITEEDLEAAALILVARCMETQANIEFTITDVLMDGDKIGAFKVTVEALEGNG